MPKTNRRLHVLLLLSLGLVDWMCWPAMVSGQVVNRGQAVIIPPSRVLSVRTDSIRAQAQYLQASGDFMVSASIARYNHAIAAQQEIRNHAEWVKTYFELKELNKAYYLKEHPPFIDRAEKRASQIERARIDNPQLVLEGDVKEGTLNWLLDKLASTSLAADALGARGPSAFQNQNLLVADVRHISFTDGSHIGGQKVLFRADEAKVLETPWPFALRGQEFDVARRGFEIARDNALKEATTDGQISYAMQMAMRGAVDELMFAMERHYPRQRRFESPENYREYSRGKQFLQSLAVSVARILETNDKQIFDGSYRFQGETVADLIRHMCRHGLEFGPPSSGDEAVYTRLFLNMRDMYLNLRDATK